MKYKHLFLTITFFSNLLLSSFAEEPTLLEHGGGVRSVNFSPVDASLVASAGESNVIKLWNLRNNTAVTLRGHTQIVNSIAFSPNGELLASGSDDRTVKLWNVLSQQNVTTLQDGARFRSVAFSPNGLFLATGGARHVKIWDVRRRAEIATLQHDTDVRAVAFSRDDRLLAVGAGLLEGPGIIVIWDVQKRKVTAKLDVDPKRVRSVSFSPDDRYLASVGWDGHLKIWDVSNWTLFLAIPHAGGHSVAFSPDSKILLSTNSGYVSLWWVEDGARVAKLPGPGGWINPVDFSHDGASFVVGGEDGKVQIWDIETSPKGKNKNGKVRILHVDTYLRQLPSANSAKMGNIPEPAPPPAVVRAYFRLDSFYEQWINVYGFPVLASAKVSPYAVKEAAWLISKMLWNRPDILRGMAQSGERFTIVAHNERASEIPDIGRNRPYPFFSDVRQRGAYCTACETVYAPEESILYPGNFARYSMLMHEMAHGLHQAGLNQIDETFDERLHTAYHRAMKKGLWRGTYAASNPDEYWAEGVLSWFHAMPSNSIKTRTALKEYDWELARLLMEVFGDGKWRYTAPATRTRLRHLQGFSPQDAPRLKHPPEVLAAYNQLRDPESDGGGKWVNLPLQDPSQLSRLKQSTHGGGRMHLFLVNLLNSMVSLYIVESDGTRFVRSVVARGVERISTDRGAIWLVKDQSGKKLGVFQAEGETGRVLIGATPRETTKKKPSLTVDINADGKVNKTDLLRVVKALGKKSRKKIRVDVNGDGIVDVADLLLVIEHLDDPEVAAAPVKREIVASLNLGMLSSYLDIVRAENDGTPAYAKAIAFLDSLRVASTPEVTTLLANYPNPFNPETWIPYQLSKPANVTLTIYAVNGTLIRTLALGHQPAGMYHSKSRAAYWDGRNKVGEAVASGIYFYTLEAGDFSATRKMLIKK